MSFYEDIIVDKSVPEFEDYSPSAFINKTGVYDVFIKLAYFEAAGKGDSKAKKLIIDFVTPQGQQLKVEEFVTNREGKTFYVDSKNNKQNIKGFSVLKAVEFIVNNIKDKLPAVEPRKIKVYNKFEKKDEMKDVFIIPSWSKKKLSITVLKKIDFQTRKNQDTGKYETYKQGYLVIYDVTNYMSCGTYKTANELINSYEPKRYEAFRAKYLKVDDYVEDKTSGGWESIKAAREAAKNPSGTSGSDFPIEEDEIPF
jgi:hypothetical protein